MTQSTSDKTKSTNKNNAKSWSYLFRVLLSFILTVLILDLVWSSLSNNQLEKGSEHYWQDVFLISLQQSLREADPTEYSELAVELSEETGLEIVVESLDQIHLESSDGSLESASSLVDINGNSYLIFIDQEQNLQIRVGPLPEETQPWLSSAVTLGFYALVALLIWIWIRPLTRGLDQLSDATQRFAQNYKEPLPQLQLRSPVKELAESIESMAADIRALIQTQIELTGGLSHEIRTPLARIKFALATARDRVGEQSQFESIEQDIDELEHLVEAMLDYSRLQQTQGVMQWSSINANEKLEELADKYRWRTGAEIQIESTENQTIEADSRLMPLAVSNLLANATRYAKSSIQIAYYSENGQQSISVSDDGPGIPEEKRIQALQPFIKNASLNDHSEGFGLGLAIVNRIATLHEGEVRLDQSAQGGLKVTIIWPEKNKSI